MPLCDYNLLVAKARGTQDHIEPNPHKRLRDSLGERDVLSKYFYPCKANTSVIWAYVLSPSKVNLTIYVAKGRITL